MMQTAYTINMDMSDQAIAEYHSQYEEDDPGHQDYPGRNLSDRCPVPLVPGQPVRVLLHPDLEILFQGHLVLMVLFQKSCVVHFLLISPEQGKRDHKKRH